MSTRRLLRSLVSAFGYRVSRLDTLPFGIDPWYDVQRLSDRLDLPVTTIIDVGANVGQSAATFLEHFPSARIISFEPHHPSFETLSQAIASPRFRAVNLALGDRAGESVLHECPESSVLNSLLAATPTTALGRRATRPVTTRVETLDRWCEREGVPTIDLLKIDTEGFDLNVLRGAEALLSRGAVSFVFTEFFAVQPRSEFEGGDLAGIDAFLAPHGFHFVAAYTDMFRTEDRWFTVANALYVRKS